jgi:outer membrane protein W
MNRNDRGWGYVLGVGPRYTLSERWGVALNANYFTSTSDNHFTQLTASVDYRLR